MNGWFAVWGAAIGSAMVACGGGASSRPPLARADEQGSAVAPSRGGEPGADAQHVTPGVATGKEHSCGLDPNGAVECWGSDAFGQVKALGHRYVQITAGMMHSCALTADGRVDCWGLSGDGRTSPPEGRYKRISAGTDHTSPSRPTAT